MGTPALAERYRAARSDPGLAVLEGLHALKHALRFGADIVDVRTRDAEALSRLARDVAPDVADRIVEAAGVVDPSTFAGLAPAPHATGVIALARRPPVDPADTLEVGTAGPVVLLERPTHHGNIGAVVRVAAAAGAAGVLVTGRHDPWHPASIRGAAGLQFALPVARVEGWETTSRPVVALDPDGEALGDRPLPATALVVFGSERTGVSEGALERADRRVAIPMRPGVSSLNLATAVAVTLYAMPNAGPSFG